MGLDDAVDRARRGASWEDQLRQEEKARKVAEAKALKAVLAEAVERLRPLPSRRLRRCEVSGWWGQDRTVTGSPGVRYRRVSEERCWVIAGYHKEPIVLTESGVLGQVQSKDLLHCDEADVIAVISTAKLGSIRNEMEFCARLPTSRPNSFNTGEFEVKLVEKRIAETIVALETNRPRS